MKARDIATAVAAVGVITYAVLPRSNTVKVLETQGQAFAAMVRASQGPSSGPLAAELRSQAERFAAEAEAALATFWEGFRDFLTEQQ